MDVISCNQCQRTPALVQDIRGCHECQSNGQASRVHARFRDDEAITDEIARAVGLVVVQQATDVLPDVVAKEFDANKYLYWACPADGMYLFRNENVQFKQGDIVTLLEESQSPQPTNGTEPSVDAGDHADDKAPVTPNPDADETGEGQAAPDTEPQTEPEIDASGAAPAETQQPTTDSPLIPD